jgi:hypothetical protein
MYYLDMNNIRLGAEDKCQYYDIYQITKIEKANIKLVNSTIDKMRENLPFDFMRGFADWRPREREWRILEE